MLSIINETGLQCKRRASIREPTLTNVSRVSSKGELRCEIQGLATLLHTSSIPTSRIVVPLVQEWHYCSRYQSPLRLRNSQLSFQAMSLWRACDFVSRWRRVARLPHPQADARSFRRQFSVQTTHRTCLHAHTQHLQTTHRPFLRHHQSTDSTGSHAAITNHPAELTCRSSRHVMQ